MRGYTLVGAQRDGVPDHLMSTGQRGERGIRLLPGRADRDREGPSGVLYGAHNPGGIMNIVSKRPLANRPRGSARLAGSWEHIPRGGRCLQFLRCGASASAIVFVAVRGDTESVVDDRSAARGRWHAGDQSERFIPLQGADGMYGLWSAIMRDRHAEVRPRRLRRYRPMLISQLSGAAFPEHGAPLYEVAYNHVVTNLQYTNSRHLRGGREQGV